MGSCQDRPEIQIVCEYHISVGRRMTHDDLIRGGGIAHLRPMNGLKTRILENGHPVR